MPCLSYWLLRSVHLFGSVRWNVKRRVYFTAPLLLGKRMHCRGPGAPRRALSHSHSCCARTSSSPAARPRRRRSAVIGDATNASQYDELAYDRCMDDRSRTVAVRRHSALRALGVRASTSPPSHLDLSLLLILTSLKGIGERIRKGLTTSRQLST